jgi:xylose isomerase
MYVSELHPLDDIFNDTYLKVFCNDKEVTKYFTSKNNFSYFHSFHMNYTDVFGKRYSSIPQQQDYFECLQEISTENISFEIWHNSERPYTRHLEFDVVLAFDYQ